MSQSNDDANYTREHETRGDTGGESAGTELDAAHAAGLTPDQIAAGANATNARAAPPDEFSTLLAAFERRLAELEGMIGLVPSLIGAVAPVIGAIYPPADTVLARLTALETTPVQDVEKIDSEGEAAASQANAVFRGIVAELHPVG